MSLPNPSPSDDPPGYLALPYCECKCGPLTGVILRRRRQGESIDSDDADEKAEKAQERYDADSYGEFSTTIPARAYKNSGGGSSSGDVSISYRGTDNSHAGYVEIQSLEYKIRVNLPYQWEKEITTIRVKWRVETRQHSGTRTNTAGTITYSESADVSYDNLSEDLTPTAGDTFVETTVRELAVPDYGINLLVIGTDESKFMIPGLNYFFDYNTAKFTRKKYGYDAYLPRDGEFQPIYTRETATAKPGSALAYSGHQSVTVSGDAVTRENTFSELVDYLHTSEEYEGGNIRHLDYILPEAAVLWTATEIQWNTDLIITLSEEDPTSRIIGRVTDLLDAVTLAFDDFLPAPFGPTGYTLLAQRQLAGHEQSYTAQKGLYRLKVQIGTLRTGITSFWYEEGQGPVFSIPEKTLKFKWVQDGAEIIDQVTIPADFGGFAEESNYSFVAYGEERTVDVPNENGLVAVRDLAPNDDFGAYKYLSLGVGVEIIAA